MTILDKLKRMIRNKGGSVKRATNIDRAVDELRRVENNPLGNLIVDASIAVDEDLLGKIVGDLQSDVVVADGKVTGTLNWVTGYTGFGNLDEQSGNYVALYARIPEIDDAVITVTADYGRETVLDPDGLFIRRIQNGDSDDKWFEITAAKDGYTKIKRRYSLNGLTLEPDPEAD